jgi:hypothetical protein
MPVILPTWEAEIGGSRFEVSLGNKSKTLSQKYPTQKWAGTGGVAQVVQHLPSQHEALSSNPIPPKRKKWLGSWLNLTKG